MKKLLPILIILVIFSSAASAAEISGSVVSDGKKLAGLAVTLSKINITTQSQNDQSIPEAYILVPLANTTTNKDGIYVFNDLNNDKYRINVTYNGTIYGENINLQGKAIVDFNLSGKIEGYVLKANKTLEGIPVRLIDISGFEVTNSSTNKNGRYSFNKVNVGGSYFVEATYADVPYTKQVNVSESANFTVYESTKEGDIIRVNVDHIVLSRISSGIKVDEYVEFLNTGDKVFFSKDRTWLGISTPQDITRFQTDVMECCLQREKDAAWIDPMNPIMPGETYGTQISYVFNPKSGNTLSRGMIYNTSYMSLISEKNNGFGIESIYAKKDIVPNEGKEFEVLTFLNIPRGQKIDIQIPGYVPSNTGTLDFNYLLLVLAIALVGAVSYPLIRKRMTKKTRRSFTKPPAPVQVSTGEPEEAESISQTNIAETVSGKDIDEMSFEELLAEKNSAFDSILALENQFNAGKISEKEYKELKKEHKEKAMLAIKQLKEAALNLNLEQPAPYLEKIIARIDDIDILEEILEREKEGENRDELKKIIEQRIDDIERNG